ncbi:MAG: His/Gly/Thr/Pro-type tRNA ligase C-terminal domain-containing protein, partial [Desulfocapsaceae bacterium]|nr:His/Gly/Thr/Pro-type tRNA ligase C-terminal domain-containing protein [Desulfocapsaceae bacterium]
GKLGAAYVLILGEDELAAGKAVLRNMATKQQQEIVLQEEGKMVQALILQLKSL